MDIIYIHDLRVEAVIGVNEWERRLHRSLRLDIELGADTRAAAASGLLADTVDYAAVAARIAAIAGAGPYQLVETLAERLAGALREEFGAPWVRVTVGKRGAVKGAAEVGVVIERGERPAL